MKPNKFILDVDQTLLNTKAFVEAATADGRSKEACITPDIWNEFRVQDFLYPDVLQWLAEKRKDELEILSAYTPELGPLAKEFQERKVSELRDFVDKITVMTGDKGPYLAEYSDEYNNIFIDDSITHHESALRVAPQVHLLYMDRSTSQGGASIEANAEKLYIPEGITHVRNMADVDRYMEKLGLG
jgi:hypothetical protein